MLNENEEIMWLKNDSESLKKQLTLLDKQADTYESKKTEILYNISENSKLIKQLAVL